MGVSIPAPVIALLTDFGQEDAYVGVMKSVIATRCDARVLDLSHGVTPHNVAQAAYLLSTAYTFLPRGTVTICVVDPGVGGKRRPIAARWPSGWFVGPDNGWLTYVLRDENRGHTGPGQNGLPHDWEAVELTNSRYFLDRVSRTFHGRDIFAPCGAALAAGTPMKELGPGIDTLVTIDIKQPLEQEGRVTGCVLHVDHFGNLITDIPASHLSDSFTVLVGGGTIHGPATSYQSAEPLIALVGSGGLLEIAAPNGSAHRLTGIGVGQPVSVATRRHRDTHS